MAVCDASYMVTFVDIGDCGRQNDSSVFNNSPVTKALNRGSLNIPNEGKLPNTCQTAKYYFTGDEAFPLKENLLPPYPAKISMRISVFSTIGSLEQVEWLKMHLGYYQQGGDC